MSTTNPSLRSIHSELAHSLRRSSDLLRRASSFRESRKDKMRPLLPADVQAIAELSFLSAFLSWETFLETSFTMYMIGKKSPSGFKPRRYVLPTDSAHAFNIIAQGRPYADWVKVQELRTRAQWYFENGEPYFTALAGIKRELEEMKVVRHRIAHMSVSAHKAFEDVVRSRTGSVPKGVTPGSFLLTINAGNSYFGFYISLLEAAAQQIVPL